MIKNYFKTAIRNLLRYKGFTLINILSLAIGLTGCLIIGLFVYDELQYDKFLPGGENIYRFYSKRTDPNGTVATASVPPMFTTYVKQQYPEVEQTNRILMNPGKVLLETGEVKSYEEKWIATDSTLFQMFPLKFLKGDPLTALNEPTALVITEQIAEKYFGAKDPMGQVLKVNKSDMIVRGVIENLPSHFHLNFKVVMPLSAFGLPQERMQGWHWQQFFSYVKLKPGTDAQQFINKFQEVVKKEAAPDDKAQTFTAFIQPLADIHLKSSEFIYDNARRGNIVYVKALSIIALFVLIIAIFNFINLATARSFRRAKEIGVRKVAGADRKQLMFQFTGETILLAVLSVAVAVAAALLLLPLLNQFTEKEIVFSPFSNPLLGLCILAIGVVIGILAGLYPALVMAGFQPIKVLKGLKPTGASAGFSASLRKGLVVVQFALSALLIVCTIIVYRQITFLHNKNLGFNKDQIVYFNVQSEVEKHPETFKQELLKSPGVVSATAGYGLPGDALAGDQVIVPGKNGDEKKSVNLFIVDHDYIKTLGLELTAGRDFSRSFSSDTSEAFIINETAVKEFGYGTAEQSIGQTLKWNKWEPDSLHPIKEGKIIGVVKDFHFKSLHEKVTASVLQIYSPVVAKVAVKIKSADIQQTLAFIKDTWNKFSPDYPIDYKFLDENFSAMYSSEDKLSSLLWLFTLMAIFVGCMGLFGLAAFSAEQRTKEIGIRKVLGATVPDIVAMLSKHFLKPVFIASVIAFPIAWWAMYKWLQDFPYRVEISWWIFAIAGISALTIAFITVSFQAIKAAVLKPVKSLRTE